VTVLNCIQVEFLLHVGTSADEQRLLVVGVGLELQCTDVYEVVNVDLVAVEMRLLALRSCWLTGLRETGRGDLCLLNGHSKCGSYC
jgi:hypothetical protein